MHLAVIKYLHSLNNLFLHPRLCFCTKPVKGISTLLNLFFSVIVLYPKDIERFYKKRILNLKESLLIIKKKVLKFLQTVVFPRKILLFYKITILLFSHIVLYFSDIVLYIPKCNAFTFLMNKSVQKINFNIVLPN
jgi:hypothetical protein